MHQPHRPPKIQVKLLLFSNKQQAKTSFSQYLLKFAPRCQSQIEESAEKFNVGKLHTKIKQLKYIKSIKVLNYSFHSKNRIFMLFKKFRNQIQYTNINDPKFLYHFPQISNILLDTKSYSSCKNIFYLANLQTLSLECSDDSFQTHNKASILQKFCTHLTACKKLKFLHFIIYNGINQRLLDFLTKLNSQVAFLQSLQSLTLLLIQTAPLQKQQEFNFEILLNSVTKLRLCEAHFLTISQILNDNIQQFKNLNTLVLSKNAQNPLEDHSDFISLDFFSELKNLQNLKNLDLTLKLDQKSTFSNFLNVFSLPKSMETVKVNFCNVNWKEFLSKSEQINLQSSDIFEQNSVCQEFYKTWASENLQNLSLSFTDLGKGSTCGLYFIAPLLKGLASLSTLTYSNWSSASPEEIEKATDFSYLWLIIANLKSLKKLYINSSAISLQSFSHETSLENAPNLQELHLDGKTFGSEKLEDFLQYFQQKSLLSTPNSSLIIINHLFVGDSEAYNQILQTLSSQPKRNLYISINLNVKQIQPDIFIKEALKWLPSILKNERIKLTFFDVPKLNSQEWNQLENLISQYRPSQLNNQSLHSIFGNEDSSKVMSFHMDIPILGSAFQDNNLFGSLYEGEEGEDNQDGIMDEFDDFSQEEEEDFLVDEDNDDANL